jgi:hypothetical protein
VVNVRNDGDVAAGGVGDLLCVRNGPRHPTSIPPDSASLE